MLANRRVLVTGASRGIGRAIALACAREGATVGVGHYRSSQAAAELAVEIEARFGRPAELCPFDVADEGAARAGVEAFAAGGGIDGLVCAAGVNLPDLLVNADAARIRAQADVNLLGPMWCARAALPSMMARRRGVIVTIGSVAAASPSRGQAVYVATKAALEALARAIAVEYGRKGIRAVCVRPGPIDTDMLRGARALADDEIKARVPLARLGVPAEVGELVAFLLSDRAAFVTGSVHAVDGGFS